MLKLLCLSGDGVHLPAAGQAVLRLPVPAVLRAGAPSGHLHPHLLTHGPGESCRATHRLPWGNGQGRTVQLRNGRDAWYMGMGRDARCRGTSIGCGWNGEGHMVQGNAPDTVETGRNGRVQGNGEGSRYWGTGRDRGTGERGGIAVLGNGEGSRYWGTGRDAWYRGTHRVRYESGGLNGTWYAVGRYGWERGGKLHRRVPFPHHCRLKVFEPGLITRTVCRNAPCVTALPSHSVR